MRALLDVNVLVALAWPNHVHHGSALRWFRAESHAGWATTPVTETGFVRVSSNPRAVPNAPAPADAIAALLRMCSWPGHSFWPDDVGAAGLRNARLGSYRHVTDAHLLALAERHKGVLVTFDQAIATLTGEPDLVVQLT